MDAQATNRCFGISVRSVTPKKALVECRKKGDMTFNLKKLDMRGIVEC